MNLYVIILTYNEGMHLCSCIESVRFADHIIVFDSFSQDDTPHFANKSGVELIQHRFENYANQRNAALEAVKGRADWVLFVDADERVSEALANEIKATLAAGSAEVGWRIPRHNYIFGKLTRGAGWYPDYQTRLLRVGAAHYDPAKQVHEVVVLDGALGTLKTPLTHYNYSDVEHFHDKQRRYSFYDASILYEQGVRVMPHNLILQPLRQFWWRFVTLKGYIDGWHGFRLSALMAWYELRKYRLLMRLWNEPSK